MEHYWPATLMASSEPEVYRWLRQDQPPATEALPTHLQSRWLDARTLPSTPLPTADIIAAVGEETARFADIFGHRASVGVPPTFVWDDPVEVAWSDNGVEFVVTPGRRNRCRDERGAPGCTGPALRNAEQGRGVTYLVRNDYFEPERGHTAEGAVLALLRRSRQGRPCLLETHRSNFIGPEADTACSQLQRLLEQALERYPDIRFISSLELGRAMKATAHPLLERRWQYRLSPWRERLTELHRFWRLARISGLSLVLTAVASAAGQSGRYRRRY